VGAQAVAISTFHNDYTGLLVLCHRILPSTAYAKLKHRRCAQKTARDTKSGWGYIKNIPPLSLSKQVLMLIKIM
jgi:hypothetical protein